MQHEQIDELARAFIDALHALEHGDEGDVDAIVALFADDAQLSNSALRLAGEERRGEDGARRFWSEYRRTFGEAHSEFAHVTAGDDAAGLFWTPTGTGNDGRSLSYDGSSLLVFDASGKISSFVGYYDTRELSRAVGVDHSADA